MGFNSGDVSNQKTKRPLPKIQTALKRRKRYDQFKDGLGGYNANLAYMHKRKDAAFSPPESVVEEDLEQLSSIEWFSDDSDLMWLSSNCKSPSMLSSDDSQDCFWNLTLHEQFSSMLSLSGSCDSIFDGSRISPIDEASLVLDRPLEGTDRGDSKEGVALWLHNAEVKSSHVVCSDSGDSSYDRSFCEDSSLFESSSSSLTTQEEIPLFVRNFDRTGIWVSSLDLDMEDSELVQDSEQGFDAFDSDFPSPSFSARQRHQSGPSRSSSATSFAQTEESESSSEVCDSSEPLFWPLDQKSYWLPEFEKNFLCLSPRKSGTSFGVQGLNSLKPVRLRLQKNNPSDTRKNMREECRRRIVFSPPSAPLPSRKHNAETLINKNIQNISITPSKLSRSYQASLEKSTRNISITERTSWLDAKSQKHTSAVPLLELEASNFQVMEGVSIEKMVGLNEFDGREGLIADSEGEKYTLNDHPSRGWSHQQVLNALPEIALLSWSHI